MNAIGKIFVFLTLAMSLIFMAFAVAVYATHKNWKEAIEKPDSGLKAQIEKKKIELTELQDERDKLIAQLSEETTLKRSALSQLDTFRLEATQKIAKLDQQREELDKKQQEAVAAMTAAQQNLDKTTKEVEVLRKDIRDAQTDRDKQFEQVVKLTDQIHAALIDVKRLTERENQLALQIATYRKRAAENSWNLESSPVPPALHGVVLAIGQNDLVEVSLGSDDGLRNGNTLEVFRGNTYLGRVQIMTTQTDRAVGKILADWTKKGAIQKGDEVATRFKIG